MAFDNRVLDRAIRERRNRLEEERRRLLSRVMEALRDIKDRFGIKEAYIVGSLLDSRRWAEFSDVDVAVAGASGHILDIMGQLEEATGKEVDVIDLDRHPNAEAIRVRGLKVYG